jgi:threonine synthase
LEDETETLKSLQAFSDMYNCELSSAVVFEAYEKLKPKGKVCLVITGVKK